MRRARLESPQGIIVVSQDPTGVFFASSPPKPFSLSLSVSFSARRGPCILFGTRFLTPSSPPSTNLLPSFVFVDIAFHSVASQEAGERWWPRFSRIICEHFGNVAVIR